MATAQKLPKLINGVAVDSLFATIDAIKATPSIAKFKFRIKNQWEDAGQNSSTVDKFSGAGGEQSRPKPLCWRRTNRPFYWARMRRRIRWNIYCTLWRPV